MPRVTFPAAQLAEILRDVGLDEVTAGPHGAWKTCIQGIIPPDLPGAPPGHGLCVIRVASDYETTDTPEMTLTEPLFLGVYSPDKRDWVATPDQCWHGLTAPQVCDEIIRLL